MLRISSRNISLLLKLMLLLMVGIIATQLPSRIVRSSTQSLRYTVFLRGFSRDIKKGSFVSFDGRYRNAGLKETFIKKVTCIEGELLTEINGDYYCSDDYLGKAMEKDSLGKLDRFKFSGKIPTGCLFVSGSHPRSYDSRYFGFIRREDVKAVNYPIY